MRVQTLCANNTRIFFGYNAPKLVIMLIDDYILVLVTHYVPRLVIHISQPFSVE